MTELPLLGENAGEGEFFSLVMIIGTLITGLVALGFGITSVLIRDHNDNETTVSSSDKKTIKTNCTRCEDMVKREGCFFTDVLDKHHSDKKQNETENAERTDQDKDKMPSGDVKPIKTKCTCCEDMVKREGCFFTYVLKRDHRSKQHETQQAQGSAQDVILMTARNEETTETNCTRCEDMVKREGCFFTNVLKRDHRNNKPNEIQKSQETGQDEMQMTARNEETIETNCTRCEDMVKREGCFFTNVLDKHHSDNKPNLTSVNLLNRCMYNKTLESCGRCLFLKLVNCVCFLVFLGVYISGIIYITLTLSK